MGRILGGGGKGAMHPGQAARSCILQSEIGEIVGISSLSLSLLILPGLQVRGDLKLSMGPFRS